jgi:hypothetical protein
MFSKQHPLSGHTKRELGRHLAMFQREGSETNHLGSLSAHRQGAAHSRRQRRWHPHWRVLPSTPSFGAPSNRLQIKPLESTPVPIRHHFRYRLDQQWLILGSGRRLALRAKGKPHSSPDAVSTRPEGRPEAAFQKPPNVGVFIEKVPK